MKTKFFLCEHCGNLAMLIRASGVPMVCCGDRMTELVAGASDGAAEKHVPVLSRVGQQITVKVGEVPHPMTDEHSIEWIVLETKKTAQVCKLKPTDMPEAVFSITAEDEPVAAYAFCNLHSLYRGA